MFAWQPQQQGLRELVVLLREAADPNNKEQALINNVTFCILLQMFRSNIVIIETTIFS